MITQVLIQCIESPHQIAGLIIFTGETDCTYSCTIGDQIHLHAIVVLHGITLHLFPPWKGAEYLSFNVHHRPVLFERSKDRKIPANRYPGGIRKRISPILFFSG